MTDRTCSVEGCGRPHYGRGWCQRHYLRWYKTGDPLAVLPGRWGGSYVRPTCSVDGCGLSVHTSGFCSGHLSRARRHGDPLAGRPKARTGSPSERFWAQVEKRGADECWPWGSRVTAGGYGQFYPGDDVSIYAHRWIYEHATGPIPEGLVIDHRCHNADVTCPGGICEHRRCVNPAHLEPVTAAENFRRGRERTNE